MIYTILLEQFARGGGGGSGGGSGGGGSSILFLIGYFPVYFLGKVLKKLFPRKLELVISAGMVAVAMVVLLVVGSADAGLEFIFFIIFVGMWSGWGAAFFGLWDKLQKRSKKADALLKSAHEADSIWNKEQLLNFANDAFLRYQRDWSSFNMEQIQHYTTNKFAQKNSLLLRALQELGRVNTMTDVVISNALIIEVVDEPGVDQDSFTVAYEASAEDALVQAASGEILFSDTSTFTEYWTFVRSDNSWLIDRIEQATGDQLQKQYSLENFAQINGMHYSLDMGWLLLPRRGVLFKKGSFGSSDINNHVVGVYNTHLFQIYTYTSIIDNQSPLYLIAQMNLPKNYGGILIKRKSSLLKRLFSRAPKGYQKFRFEWPDFTKRYQVYATDADRLALFELLNPAFMAHLYDTDTKVNIEVVDNIVYLYKQTTSSTEHDYNVMLDILNRSFKELKL
jgi:hypothetical protein